MKLTRTMSGSDGRYVYVFFNKEVKASRSSGVGGGEGGGVEGGEGEGRGDGERGFGAEVEGFGYGGGGLGEVRRSEEEGGSADPTAEGFVEGY